MNKTHLLFRKAQSQKETLGSSTLKWPMAVRFSLACRARVPNRHYQMHLPFFRQKQWQRKPRWPTTTKRRQRQRARKCSSSPDQFATVDSDGSKPKNGNSINKFDCNSAISASEPWEHGCITGNPYKCTTPNFFVRKQRDIRCSTDIWHETRTME